MYADISGPKRTAYLLTEYYEFDKVGEAFRIPHSAWPTASVLLTMTSVASEETDSAKAIWFCAVHCIAAGLFVAS